MGSLRIFALYGPFQYGGRAASQSNARFDAMLRSRDPESGVRDFEHIRALAGRLRLGAYRGQCDAGQ
jgi:nucleoside-diphosphate-sugar epimerase